MAAHRYWRVLIPAGSSSSGYIGLSAVEMRVVAGGATVCTGGTALSSGDYDGNYPPANAFDGNNATQWESPAIGNQYAWVGYDFGAGNAKDIAEIVIRTGNWANEYPSTFRVQASDDAYRWFDVWVVTGQAGWGTATARTFTRGADLRDGHDLAHRYWRLNMLFSWQGNYQALAEVQLRAGAGGADLTAPGGALTTTDQQANAYKSIDDNAGTYWESSATIPQFWRYDFGAGNAQAVREVTMQAPHVSVPTELPRRFAVEYSDDDATWVQVASYYSPAVAPAAGEIRTYTWGDVPAPPASPARSVVMVCT